MNQSIKNLLRKTDGAFPTQWDKYLDPLLFALQEISQDSTSINPFEFIFGRCPCSFMKVMQDGWIPPDPAPGHNPHIYMAQLQEQLEWAQSQAPNHLQQAQTKQKQLYDKTSKIQQFKVGDGVLLCSTVFPSGPS